MRVRAIDPGNEESAIVTVDGGVPLYPAKMANAEVLNSLKFLGVPRDLLAVEMIASYGMSVGKEVFDTCLWVGRFIEAWEDRGGATTLVYRREVKLHFCETSRANDSAIRTAIIDRFGGKVAAIGKKANPGPLYNLKGDMWSAFAVGLTVAERTKEIPYGLQAASQESIVNAGNRTTEGV